MIQLLATDGMLHGWKDVAVIVVVVVVGSLMQELQCFLPMLFLPSRMIPPSSSSRAATISNKFRSSTHFLPISSKNNKESRVVCCQ
jgi:hypothetical protein